ncbi:MAG: undecaprenyl-diphosphate phosphatase, partial [Proteobacteria bacterium]|nr:undecaprenyl-diphosphate phosphatase [Pseudomonadota bacterium]
MESLQSVMLGIIQGLTEFLPVSSSGHLVLLQNLFGITEPELLFDISLHVG